MRSPVSSSGPISIRAVTNWLDTAPLRRTVPPRLIAPVIVTGRRPAASPGLTPAPRAARASCNSPIGRARSGGSPSIVTGVAASAAKAVTKRDVVPASPASRRSVRGCNRPLVPPTATTPACRSSTPTPRSARHRSIAVVSSPSGTLSNTLSPSASAAATNARLAMLFEPGTVTSPWTGPAAAVNRFTRAATPLDADRRPRARCGTPRRPRRRQG